MRIATTDSVFDVRAGEPLNAFLEFESSIRTSGELLDNLARFFQAFRVMKTRIPPVVITIALVCVTLFQNARAVNPPPDGGYGNQNTAEGTDALFSLTSGVWNVAVGFEALRHDTTGNQSTAVGYRALFSNTTGDKSTAYGSQALYNNLSGNDNVANGFSSLYSNTGGNRNTGNGYRQFPRWRYKPYPNANAYTHCLTDAECDPDSYSASKSNTNTYSESYTRSEASPYPGTPPVASRSESNSHPVVASFIVNANHKILLFYCVESPLSVS